MGFQKAFPAEEFQARVLGVKARMAETALCGATTPNAYRRRQPYTFCPINTAWDVDNRTVGLRIIEGSDSAVRIEKRDGSPRTIAAPCLAPESRRPRRQRRPTAGR